MRELNTRLEEGLTKATKDAKRETAKLQARVSHKHTCIYTCLGATRTDTAEITMH